MALNILVGIGGTGAKVVEAVLHGCAAGLGPEELTVGLIDQDKSNGNVSRARETLSALVEARSNWRREAGEHYLTGSSLLSTALSHPDRIIWTPHPDQNTTLVNALGHLGEDEPLLHLLFKPDHTEQRMDLGIGYQGKAHVGSAAITAAIDKTDETFWRTLFDTIAAAKSGTTVRVVLAGSVFGGTGAAGFPTVARLIRRHVGEDKNFHLGGVLMLPYFRFDPPEEGSTVARSEDLLPQTRGALRYYHNLREHVFDDLFVVGWDKYFELGYHRPGTGEQRNPALVPELIASLAAFRFYNPDYDPTSQIHISSRRDADSLAWGDLPSPVESDSTLPYRALGQQLRFAAAWKHWWPILSKEAGEWQDQYQHYAWYRRFGLAVLDHKGAQLRQAVTSMNAYIDDLIEWAATIQAYAQRSNLQFNLWDVQDLLAGPVQFTNPTHPVTVKQRLSAAEYGDVSRKVIQARSPSEHLTDGAWLLRELCSGRPSGNRGLGAIVAALHDLSATNLASKNARQ